MQATFSICIPHPCGYCIGVLLIRRTLLDRKVPAPQGRVHFCHDRTALWHLPAVEWPEMEVPWYVTEDEQQPRQTGMSGLGHRSLHVEPKHGLGGPCSLLSQP